MKSSLRILYLEDNPNDVELVQGLLEQEGLDCLISNVQTRNDFLTKIGQEDFDIILADYNLPDFDGMTALKNAREKCPEIPVILLSGIHGEELAVECLKNGGTDYILKERISRLVPALNRALREAHERRERNRVEEQLRKLSHAVEQSASSVIITDTEGRIEYVNAKFCRLTGYSVDEVKGQTPRILKSGRIPQEIYKGLWEKIINGDHWQGEFCNSKKNGDPYWVTASISPIKNAKGDITHFIGIQEDITARKNAEEALRESQRAISTLMSNLPGLAYRCLNDWEWTMEFVSEGCMDLTGYQPADLINNQKLSYAELIHPEDRKLIWDEVQTSLQNAQPFKLMYRIKTANGEEKWVSEQGRGVFSPEGKLLAIEGFIIDITDRKRAAEKLERHARELARSNAELEQFASIASHDLQEPLRKVRVFGERLQEKFGLSLNEQGKDYLSRMLNAAKRMENLLSDLLKYARVTTKAQPFEAVNLNEVARGVLSDLEIRIEQTGAKIEMDELPTIEADPVQMRQLLQNLIGNALKFHRQDIRPVIKISAKLLKDREHWWQRPSEIKRCELTIEDNGIGFDEKYRDRIFGIFQRLNERSEYEGSGIGLAICWKIVERHGGKIDVKSNSGEGASFLITLPVKQQRNGN